MQIRLNSAAEQKQAEYLRQEQKNQTLNKQLEYLKKCMRQIDSQIDEQEQKNEEQKTLFDELELKNVALKQNLKEAHKRNSQGNQCIEETEQKIKEFEAAYQTLIYENQKMLSEVSLQQIELKKSEGHLSQQNQNYEREVRLKQDLETEIGTKKHELKSLQKEIRKLEEQIEKMMK